MEYKIRIKSRSIVVLLLFVFSLILKDYLYIGLLFCAVALVFGRRLFRPSWKGLFISLFSILYLVIYIHNFGYSKTILLACLLITGVFYVGQQLNGKFDIEKLGMIIIAAFMIHAVILLIFGIRTTTIMFGEIRAYKDVFLGIELGATGIEAYYVPIIGSMYYLLKYKPNIKFIVVLVISVVFISCVLIGGRGIIIISALTVVLCYYFDYKFFVKNTQKAKTLFRALLILLSAIVLFEIILSFNIFGVRSYFESSLLMSRFIYMRSTGQSIFSSVERMEQNKLVLDNLADLWLTGGRKTGYSFVHNTILSMVNSTGVFPAICYSFFLIATLWQAYKRCIESIAIESILFIGIIISSILFQMMEPVFESSPWMIAIISLISGLQAENYNSSIGESQ